MKIDLWSIDVYAKNVFDNRGELAKYTECPELTCGYQTYVVPVQPRLIGVRVTRNF